MGSSDDKDTVFFCNVKLLGNNCKQSWTTAADVGGAADVLPPPRGAMQGGQHSVVYGRSSSRRCAIGGENDYFLSPLVIVEIQHTVL